MEKPSLPSIASFDPSNPLGFLEKVLDFIGKESDFFLKDTAEKEMASAVTAAKKRSREAKEEKVKFGAYQNNWNVLPGEVPNKGNGLDLEKYSWTQNPKEVKIAIPVRSGTNVRSITCEIKKNRLKVGFKGQEPIIDGVFFNAVKPDDCFWTTMGEKFIFVILAKQDPECWPYCMRGEPEIDIQKVKTVILGSDW